MNYMGFYKKNTTIIFLPAFSYAQQGESLSHELKGTSAQFREHNS